MTRSGTGPVRPGLTTMWGHGRDDRLDLIDSRVHTGLMRWLFAFWRMSRGRRAVVLRGTVTLREGYRDLLGAVLIRRLRTDPPVVVVSDATITPASQGLTRRLGPLAGIVRPLARLLIRAADGPRVRWCVLSTVERDLFARTWGVPPERVVFTPFQHTLWNPADREVPPRPDQARRARVFSGGNSLRDYARLLQACDGLPVDLFIATSTMPARSSRGTEVRNVDPQEFVTRLRDCDVLVVPLAGSTRSAGQQTYLNGMALEKVVIVSDPLLAALDYIEDGATGVVVDGSVDALRAALADAIDPERHEHYEQMRRRARESVLARFTTQEYWAGLLAVAGLADPVLPSAPVVTTSASPSSGAAPGGCSTGSSA
jgi:hypothetical protein